MKPLGRLLELSEDWRFLIRRKGLKTGLSAVGLDVARLPYRHLKFVVLARSLKDPFPVTQPLIALEVRLFAQADLNLVREIDRPSEARLCERRLARGQKGLIAIYHGIPAGYAWACTEVDPDLERVHLQLELGDVLCTDGYTSPAFRGLGIQTELTLARFRLFRDLGYCRAVCYIEQRNYPSLAVWQRKFGSLTTGNIDFKRFGSWYSIRYTQS